MRAVLEKQFRGMISQIANQLKISIENNKL